MDDLTRTRIMDCINDFDDFTRSRSIQLTPLRTNIVLSLRSDPDDPNNYACNYYIANHDTRTIFWLDSVDAKTFPVWWEVKGVTSPTHIAFSEHAIVSFYWYHCHLFPHSYKLTTEAVDGLRDILMHAFCDAITSTTSTVPYSLTDMEKMILLSNNLRKNPGTGGVSALSRLMYIFARLRFVHFHGQPAARLDRDQSVHEEAWKRNRRPWWMKWLSPVFFSTPDLYYRILLGIWVDDLVHESSWAEFMDKMRNEWQQLALFNTVLLNANVAFLAIQSIDNSSNSPGRSPAQIASFLSTVASFGSIILGLLLANTHRAKAEDSAGSVARIFGSWGRSNRPGLATLAFLYGVPYALLLWGLVCFFVAFSAMCYIDSDVFVRSLVSSAWFVIVMLGLWCATVLSDWDHHDSWQEESFWSYAGDVLPLLWSGLQYVIDGIIKISAFSWQSLHTQQMSVRVDDRPPIESEDGNARKRLNPTVTSDVQIEITVIEP
ncbi:hypothetical protein F5880DRAFT_1521865 [Lentinula raphanica]|nr:hypothetical protein F5880DRAFT_1521865 [Lentinula raphanica]